MSERRKYWFPAKRYGWGWGLPSTWQGWVVVGTFGALAVLGIFFFPPQHELLALLLYLGALNLALMAVCWIKGEPPSWRWGGK